MPEGNPMGYFTPEQMQQMDPNMLAQLLIAQTLQQRGAPAAAQPAVEADPYSFFDYTTPEGRREQTDLGTLDERGALLGEQMARAQALQNRAIAPRGTGGGAALSGLGGVVDAVRGGLAERDARAQQQALLGQKDTARANYMEDLGRGRAFKRGMRTAGAADVPMLPGMG